MDQNGIRENGKIAGMGFVLILYLSVSPFLALLYLISHLEVLVVFVAISLILYVYARLTPEKSYEVFTRINKLIVDFVNPKA